MNSTNSFRPSLAIADKVFTDQHNITENQIIDQKEKLLKLLTDSSGKTEIFAQSEFAEQLQTLSFEQLEKLSEVKNIFFSNFSFSFRTEILKTLLGESLDQWNTLALQIHSILLYNLTETNLRTVLEILIGIKNINHRHRLTILAGSLISYDTSSELRVKILTQLASFCIEDFKLIDELRSADYKKEELRLEALKRNLHLVPDTKTNQITKSKL